MAKHELEQDLATLGSMAPEASAPTCRGCGAPLPIALSCEEIRCRHCNAAVPLDQELRQAMLAYVGDVVDAAKREMNARFDAAFFVQNQRATGFIIGGTVGLAIFLTGAFVAWSITRQSSWGIPLVYLGILLGGWGLSLLAFAVGWHIMYDIPPLARMAAVGVVRCGGCGAVQAMEAGEVQVACRHCKSHLLVPCTLAGSLLEATKTSAEEVQRERERSLQHATSSGDRLVLPAQIFIIATTVAAVLGVLWIGRPQGVEVSSGVMWLAFLALFLVALAVLVWSTKRGMRRRDEIDKEIAELVRRAAEPLR
jgi:hypothetical protein